MGDVHVMTQAFVTGATGFVGNAVARALIQSGRKVKVLARKNSDHSQIKDLPVEIVYGDLRDPKSLHEGLKGCDELYHVAAQYSFHNPDTKLIYETNVDGTRNILQAALDCNLYRVVYTSTVGTIGIPPDGGIGDENTTLTLDDCKGHYKRSKFLAEQEALEFAQKGLPVIIVNPSAPVGVRDIKPTPTGKMIVDFLNRKVFAYMKTGLNLIDVEDVATAHILAAQKGKPGERYILGNTNLTLYEILGILSELTGIPQPRTRIPYPLVASIAYMSETFSKFSRRPPRVELEAVRLQLEAVYTVTVRLSQLSLVNFLS